MKSVALDAGHGIGAPNFGAVGPSGRTERDAVLEISIIAADLLASDYNIILTRPDDYDTPYQTRCDLANNAGCFVFVSLHCNGYNGQASGIETLYKSDRGKLLAGHIQQRMLELFPDSKDRGLKYRSSLYVLNGTKMPAALVEHEFIDSMEHLFIGDENLHKWAQAVADGIRAYDLAISNV